MQFDPSDVIQALVLAGVDVNGRPNGSETLLMLAAARGDTCALASLLRDGARVDDRNAQGLTALDFAKQTGSAGAIRVLSEAARGGG